MRPCSDLSLRPVGCVAGLILLALCGEGLGQTPSSQSPPIWGVNCTGTPAGLDCRALQNLPMTNSGVATVAVRLLPETKKPVLLVLVPLGIHLPAGATVQIGQEEAKRLPLQNCNSTGCLAEYPLADAELAALLKGEAMTISVQDRDKRPISVQVPATGFPAAYAKIK